ncbi:MAG TPA: carboxypeptidase-like regulatory domain-containing protein, partial [Polyangiaceae bacterium]|nr:carboxypeptidase-like regulatory domain-containing protein [Polyangiaceae bacterium]
MQRRRWLYPSFFVISSWALAWGCDKDNGRPEAASTDITPGGGPTDYGPVLAQACSPEGSVRECGRVYHTDGDYVYCSVGHSTCTDGAWGTCVGDRVVIKSSPSLRLSSAGLQFQAVESSCTNACDPYCLQIEKEPKTVSSPGIVPAADAGGVTLEWKEITVDDLSNCVGLQCSLVICGGSSTTTITGRVFDPAGKNPLYNAEVYIPLHPTDPLPSFNSGASCDTCGGAQSLDAIRAVQTDANGRFVLSDVPAGQNIPIVVQMGKWRREIVLKEVKSCQDNQIAGNCTAADPNDCVFRLPRHQTDGFDPVLGTYTKADMPQTAIITGSADPFDCLLLKAGIAPTEVGDSASNKRFHFYHSDSSAGNTLGSAYGSKVLGSTLWNDLNGPQPNMMSYDVILLPCEGGAYDKQTTKVTATNTPYKNLLDYVNTGGRAFATHYTYSWLAFMPFYAL